MEMQTEPIRVHKVNIGRVSFDLDVAIGHMLVYPPVGIYRKGDVDPLGGGTGCFQLDINGRMVRIDRVSDLYDDVIYDINGDVVFDIEYRNDISSIEDLLTSNPTLPVTAILAVEDMIRRTITSRTGYELISSTENSVFSPLISNEFLSRHAVRSVLDLDTVDILMPLFGRLMRLIENKEFSHYDVKRVGRIVFIEMYEDVRVMEWRRNYENGAISEILGAEASDV